MFFCEPRFPYFQAVKKIHKCKFTPEEDERLKQLVAIHGENEWATIAQEMGNRNSRQCRERWRNYMNPRLTTENWTPEDDKLLLERYAAIGPHWNMIAQAFPNRSVNCVRNRVIKVLRMQGRSRECARQNAPQLPLPPQPLPESQTHHEAPETPDVKPESPATDSAAERVDRIFGVPRESHEMFDIFTNTLEEELMYEGIFF